MIIINNNKKIFKDPAFLTRGKDDLEHLALEDLPVAPLPILDSVWIAQLFLSTLRFKNIN